MAREAGERKLVAQNRRAFHDYAVEERFEAGLVLSGTEVKSLREGRATITEAHAGEMGGELWLFNAYIPEFHGGTRFNHETRRPRKLMLRRREANRLFGAVRREGMTLVPIALYFTPRGWAPNCRALGGPVAPTRRWRSIAGYCHCTGRCSARPVPRPPSTR